MRVSEELRAYEAAGSLAEELPYWGWLDDGRTCLTRSGELIAAGRRWSLTLRFDFLERIPSELVVHNPMGILITYLQADQALVTGQEP